jgi:cystathionine beta-lyase/cystathionine gamma-synthase
MAKSRAKAVPASVPASGAPVGGRRSIKSPGTSTLAVHAGEASDPRSGAVNVPIQQSTTFRFPEMEDGSKAPYIYSRYENPSVESVEAKVAALEQAEHSLLFASGMAAIQAACVALVKPGQTIAVQRGVYGGTTAYLNTELAPTGVKVVEIDAHDEHAPAKLPKGTVLVWLESITNPVLRVADPRPWADAAHDAGAKLAVDATFATPLLQRPLSMGADVVMHSATKYMGGHADVTAGVLSCGPALRENLWTRRRNLGATLDPHAAYLLGRGMKTLPLRVERHCSNAWALAQECEDMKGVAAVHYPGLPSHPDHAVARKVLSGGFGGMLTLDLGSKAAAQSFRRRVKLITPAASLGGVESLVSLPLETSHAYASPAKRRADGVADGLVRISVGIEDAADLAADLRQAIR